MVSTDSSTSSGGAKRSKLSFCKAQGCTADLCDAGKYCLKKRLCPRHLRADALRLTDQGETLFRFCQQCGKLEPLARFEGNKRSCRTSLAKRRVSHAEDDTAAAPAQPIHACQQQQQSHVDFLMHSSSSLCSSLDTCAGATLAATHEGAVANTIYLPVMTAPAAAHRAWSADAAAAALAEEWCGFLQQQQQQQGEEDELDRALQSLLELGLHHSSSSSSDKVMGSDVDLMLLLEQELLAAAAAAGCAEGLAPSGAAAAATASSGCFAVAQPALFNVTQQSFYAAPAQQMTAGCAAGAPGVFMPAACYTSTLPYQLGTGAAVCSAPAAAALSRSFLQQRLQELTMQCAQLSQMYNELVTSQSQIQSAAAAVSGADVLTCWEGYL